jgi:hypothetical protein
MLNHDSDSKGPEQVKDSSSHTGWIAALCAGLVVALAVNGFLIVRSNNLSDQLTQVKDDATAQISKLGDTTTSLLETEKQRLAALSEDIKSANSTASTAVKQARFEVKKQSDQIAAKIDEQQQQVASELGQLKDATTSASSKINEVSTDVSGVKTDVGAVKTDLSATQSELEKTGADLKRAMGDMGVMSGLIATNGKDLQALRELGERNYIEFDLGKTSKKVGDVTLMLRKADPKRNRYTVEIVADDTRVEKKDKTINEPVQLYVHGDKHPYEIVVNQIKKDQVIGYLATPKVSVARR